MHSLTARDQERFWSKVQVRSPDQCWPWTAAATTFGHGRFKVAGKLLLSHRVALILDGRDPGQLLALHSCDNPRCCNPAHLRVGGYGQNAKDMVRRNRRDYQKGTGVHTAKLTESDVRLIRRSACPAGVWASLLGVGKTTARDIKNGKTWKHVMVGATGIEPVTFPM